MPAIALSSALVGGFAHTANKESPASYMPVVANAFAASAALIGALYDLSSASDAPVMPSGCTSDSVETFCAPGRTDSNSPAWMRRNSSACTHGTTRSQMTCVASSPGVSRMSLSTSRGRQHTKFRIRGRRRLGRDRRHLRPDGGGVVAKGLRRVPLLAARLRRGRRRLRHDRRPHRNRAKRQRLCVSLSWDNGAKHVQKR